MIFRNRFHASRNMNLKVGRVTPCAPGTWWGEATDEPAREDSRPTDGARGPLRRSYAQAEAPRPTSRTIPKFTATAGTWLVLLLVFLFLVADGRLTRAAESASKEKDSSKTAAVTLKLDFTSDVVLDKDRNGMPAKTKLIPTASFDGYTLTPVVDGARKKQELEWADAAWASTEDDSVHGIEIQLGKPKQGGRFQVTWAYDANGDPKIHWWPSRNYVIQVKEKAGDDWKTVVEVKNNQSIVSCHALPRTPFSFLRIYQTSGGGPASRPDIMWIGQVEFLE
jgi:hypothetical protein